MTDRERIAIGAIAGALVAIVGYPLSAYESIMSLQEGLLLAIGLAFRTFAFAFLGGLWSYLHRSENDRVKIFQLGLLGPAIVSAMVSANAAKLESEAVSTAAWQIPSLISPAYAQARPTTPQLPPTTWDSILRGLLGTTVVKLPRS